MASSDTVRSGSFLAGVRVLGEYMSDNVYAPQEILAKVGVQGRQFMQHESEKRGEEPLQHYLQNACQFWFGWFNALMETAHQEAESDKRFAGSAWRKDPRFNSLQHSYRSYSRFLMRAVDSAPVSETAKGQMRFVLRQVVDALSPANFLATNPEALQLALETHGGSLSKGIELFFQDAAKGRITMSDEKAFEVGKNIAASDGAVVYENELMQLIQYRPLTKKVAQRPLLMVPPCINKFYILDLQPENSLVRYAVEQGHTVFMLSWRNITPELGHLTWDDYLQKGVIQAVEVARDICGVDQINALGFCIGGAMLSSAVAAMQARGRDSVASMTLLTTMLDYADTGEIGLLVNEHSVRAREQTIGGGGLMQGKELALTFSSLRANDLIWPYVVNGYLKGQPPEAFDLLYWNADATNLPGPMFSWYMRNTYLENNLRKPGKTVQCGEPIDLRKITVPTYIFASREDHLVPWMTCFESTRILDCPTTFVLGASGHIAGVINAPVKGKRNYWVNDAVTESPDAWLASSHSMTGSWWPHWAKWLKKNASGQVPARPELGNRVYQEIEAAPGRYVKERPH
jgi:polyhydroxyalkanoate synthase